MGALKIDPDFLQRMHELGPSPDLPQITTPLQYRARADAYIGSLLNFPIPDNVIETKFTIVSYDGSKIEVYRFQREDMADQPTSSPALIYAHGGGIVACELKTVTRPEVALLVAESGVQAFAMEYRMAPEYPYPTPVEDCYATLKWVFDHAGELMVDPTRVAVIGESGGAGLAVGVAFLARDRGLSPPLAKQILIYPMLDNMSPSNVKIDDPRRRFVSDYVNYTRICWDAYLGADNREKRTDQIPHHGSPARAEDVSGLPSTYLDVGSLDLFRDESLAFALKVAAAGIDVEMHLYSGVPHCFDMIAPNIAITRNAKENRIRAIRNM